MDTDNASLLTNACALLERYKEEEKRLLEHKVFLEVRLEAVRDVINSLDGKPRTRRTRQPKPEQPQDDTASIDAFAELSA